MNLNVAPFDNVLVRQAFNLAIDKSTIVDIVLEGAGEVTEGIFNDTTFGYSENVTGYEYDPQKAKELLVSAGYPDGFDVKLGTLAGSMEMTSQILQQNLKEIGINVEIEVFEQSSFIQDVMSGNFTMATFSITLLADADFYSMCFHSNSVDGGLNVSNYSNDKVDELFDAAKEIIDPATRIEIYEQVAQIISDDAVIIPVYFPTKMYPTNSNLIIEDVEKFGVSKLDKMHWK
jgi:ABC-type transport system substrate-binding protein